MTIHTITEILNIGLRILALVYILAAIFNPPGSSALWLGTDDADPKVLHHQAASVGVHTTSTEGWVPYPIPEEVSLNTRMHLNRHKVEALIHHLQAWLDTGSLKIRREKK
jgi:hypothetical protein